MLILLASVFMFFIKLAVCWIKKPGCPFGVYTKDDGSKKCPIFTYESLSYFDAREHCRLLNARLPEIRSERENQIILMFSGATWLGLSDVIKEGRFLWDSDNSPTNYTNWLNPKSLIDAQRDCVLFTPDGRWQILECSKSTLNHLVCEGDVNRACTTLEYTKDDGKKYCGFQTTRKNGWPTAKLYCESLDGRLTEIRSEKENNDIAQRTRKNIWIGLSDFETEGRFVWSSDHSDPSFTNWFTNLNLMNRDENCVGMLKSSGQWVTENCSTPVSALCEMEMTTSVCQTSKYIKLDGTTVCGVILPHMYTWFDANERCKKINGTLPEARSKRENEEVRRRLRLMEGEDAWIGISDFEFEGNYVWSTNNRTLVTYTNWAPREPRSLEGSEDCGVMFHALGSWGTINCLIRKKTMCEMKLSTGNNVLSTSRPILNLAPNPDDLIGLSRINFNPENILLEGLFKKRPENKNVKLFIKSLLPTEKNYELTNNEFEWNENYTGEIENNQHLNGNVSKDMKSEIKEVLAELAEKVSGENNSQFKNNEKSENGSQSKETTWEINQSSSEEINVQSEFPEILQVENGIISDDTETEFSVTTEIPEGQKKNPELLISTSKEMELPEIIIGSLSDNEITSSFQHKENEMTSKISQSIFGEIDKTIEASESSLESNERVSELLLTISEISQNDLQLSDNFSDFEENISEEKVNVFEMTESSVSEEVKITFGIVERTTEIEETTSKGRLEESTQSILVENEIDAESTVNKNEDLESNFIQKENTPEIPESTQSILVENEIDYETTGNTNEDLESNLMPTENTPEIQESTQSILVENEIDAESTGNTNEDLESNSMPTENTPEIQESAQSILLENDIDSESTGNTNEDLESNLMPTENTPEIRESTQSILVENEIDAESTGNTNEDLESNLMPTENTPEIQESTQSILVENEIDAESTGNTNEDLENNLMPTENTPEIIDNALKAREVIETTFDGLKINSKDIESISDLTENLTNSVIQRSENDLIESVHAKETPKIEKDNETEKMMDTFSTIVDSSPPTLSIKPNEQLSPAHEKLIHSTENIIQFSISKTSFNFLLKNPSALKSVSKISSKVISNSGKVKITPVRIRNTSSKNFKSARRSLYKGIPTVSVSGQHLETTPEIEICFGSSTGSSPPLFKIIFISLSLVLSNWILWKFNRNYIE